MKGLKIKAKIVLVQPTQQVPKNFIGGLAFLISSAKYALFRALLFFYLMQWLITYLAILIISLKASDWKEIK